MKTVLFRYFFLFFKLFLATFWFFIIYHYALVLGFSFVTLSFITLFVGLLSGLTFLGFGRVWPFFVIALSFLFTFFSLVNFVYITVFDTFLDFGFGQNSYTLLSTFFEFYTAVPWYMYLSALAFFVCCTWMILVDYKKLFKHRLTARRKDDGGSHFFTDIPRVVCGVVLSILFGVSGLVFSGYLEKNPNQDWWSSLAYVRDYGVAGHVFSSVYGVLSTNTSGGVGRVYAKQLEDLIVDGEKQEPEEPKVQVGDDTTVLEKKRIIRKPLTRFDYLRKHVDQTLPGKQTTSLASISSTTTSFPAFTQKPNIIIYQLESIPSWGMKNGLETMPKLSSLMNEHMHVGRFFGNGCHTVDAEFSTLCSFYPHVKKPVSTFALDGEYYCLPQLLSDAYEYKTALFHANKPEFWDRDVLGPKWGFHDMFFIPHFPRHKVDDGDVLNDAVSYIEKSEEPILAYVIGYSSHSPHTTWEMDYLEEVSGVTVSPYTGPLSSELLESVEIKTERDLRIYLGFYELIDNTIDNLFASLKEKELDKNTIVVVVNDHRLYNFYGDSSVDNFYNYNELPFLLYVPGMKGARLADIASHIDIAPTLLHVLEGGRYVERNHFLGKSLFSGSHPNHSFSSCHDMSYLVHPDGVVVHNTKNNIHTTLQKDGIITDEKVARVARQMGIINMLRNTMLERNLVKP